MILCEETLVLFAKHTKALAYSSFRDKNNQTAKTHNRNKSRHGNLQTLTCAHKAQEMIFTVQHIISQALQLAYEILTPTVVCKWGQHQTCKHTPKVKGKKEKKK